VLGRDGGALPHLLRPFRIGLGAVLGSGRQWVSWIHVDDLVRLIEFTLDTPAARGALNAVAPTPVTHLDMQRAIGRALHRPVWLRVPAVMLRAGLGEMSQLLVDGQRVVPSRAVALGFRFRFAHLPQALADLVGLEGAPVCSLEAQQRAATAQVYFNGECPVCRAEMDHYAALCARTRPHIEFIDASQHPDDFADCGLRREHLERRVYIRDAAGRVISGMPALVALWSTLPRYRLLSRLFNLPVLRQASVMLYDHLVSPNLARWAEKRARRASLMRHA
jgi:predicted DCC family thiol-disulfide oxidoreductase YuxK